MSLPAWLAATRPKTLPAAVAPVALGVCLAATVAAPSWPQAWGCLLGALLIQIASNFANDALDFRKGADGGERLGPVRAVASGAISYRAMVAATLLLLALAGAIGCWLALRGGWPILALGGLSLICAWAYTGGPFPLADHGLGELFVLLFFGLFAVLGTAWIQIAPLPSPAGPLLLALPVSWWLLAAAVGLQCTAILMVNNLRDREQDAAVGKRTLAVRLGAERYRLAYALTLALAAALIALSAWLDQATWLYLPAAVAALGGRWLARAVARRQGAALNPCLGLSALLELLTAAALGLALLLGQPPG